MELDRAIRAAEENREAIDYALFDRRDELMARIFATPATGLAGLAVQARAYLSEREVEFADSEGERPPKKRFPASRSSSRLYYLDCETDRTACWRNSMGSRSPCCASSMIFLARASATGPLRSTRNVPNASSNARTKTLISSGPNEAFCRRRVIGIMRPNRSLAQATY
jgi:hypothetical protein